jgi:hypothetical protein
MVGVVEVVAGVTAAAGLGGGAWGAFAHLVARIEASKAGLVSEQAKFIETTLAREERCREENHDLRNEITLTQARLLVVERSAMLAEVNLELRGKLDQVLDHFGITPVIRHAKGELSHG